MPVAVPNGSAARWGPLWGARPGDWTLSEVQHVPGYEAALGRVGLQPGQRVLDIGCGTGVFLRLVVERSGTAFGLDASEALLETARRRVPEADLRVADMESLPYGDDGFDLVTGFTSMFFATDIVAALREAGRVAKPGAALVIQVWGSPERCDLEAMKVVARPFLPPRPPGAPSAPELWRPGALGGARGPGRVDSRGSVRRGVGLRVSGQGHARPGDAGAGWTGLDRRTGARGRTAVGHRRRFGALPHGGGRLSAGERVPLFDRPRA